MALRRDGVARVRLTRMHNPSISAQFMWLLFILDWKKVSEAHSATDEAWHLPKLGSSTPGKEFTSYELN